MGDLIGNLMERPENTLNGDNHASSRKACWWEQQERGPTWDRG